MQFKRLELLSNFSERKAIDSYYRRKSILRPSCYIWVKIQENHLYCELKGLSSIMECTWVCVNPKAFWLFNMGIHKNRRASEMDKGIISLLFFCIFPQFPISFPAFHPFPPTNSNFWHTGHYITVHHFLYSLNILISLIENRGRNLNMFIVFIFFLIFCCTLQKQSLGHSILF